VIISSLRSTGIQGAPRYALEVLMAPLCDLIIANSEAGMRDLAARGVSPDRILVIRNGLDLSRFAGIERPQAGGAGESRIGMVAQMEPRKDHHLLITAFARVLRQQPEARLLLAGDGRLRSDIDAHVRSAGISGSVEMPGTVARSGAVYRRLTLYVQASASEEGTSNSIVEAMASGLPVIATDVGGNAETVRHQETGLIVPPRDPEALAGAILSLLEDPVRRRAMGARGRAVALAEYSRARMVDATVAAYEAALGKARPSGGRR
jgi:glycosyltransferase involved in cell wall biosynthesis